MSKTKEAPGLEARSMGLEAVYTGCVNRVAPKEEGLWPLEMVALPPAGNTTSCAASARQAGAARVQSAYEEYTAMR